MTSALAWLGLGMFLCGVTCLVTGLLPWTPSAAVTLIGAAWIMAVLSCFAWRHDSAASLPRWEPRSKQLPVAFVLAFEDDTDPDARMRGELEPGDGNRELAHWVEHHASAFSAVLTQEAVISVLANGSPQQFRDGTHIGNTPAYRMHEHSPEIVVRTLGSLACALARFGDTPPPSIVLVAHPKQIERAYRDLRCLYRGEILIAGITTLSYRKKGSRLQPLLWARRELFVARPIEAIQRRFPCRCQSKVVLPILPSR